MSTDQLLRVVSENRVILVAGIATAYIIKSLLPLADSKQNFQPLDIKQLQSTGIFNHYLINKQGLYLYTHRWENLPVGKQPIGIIYLIHGFGEHLHRCMY